MSVIKIENFGGEMPSMSPRALPPNAAQKSQNLFLGTNEFRPVAGDREESVPPERKPPAGAKTLFRITPADPWRADTQETSPVRGQVNGATSTRTYFTLDSSDAAPRVIDMTGENRQLGVPKPTVKPAVAVVVGDELSKEELPDAESKSADLIAQAIDANITSFLTGGGIAFQAPTATSYGWIPHESDPASSYILAPTLGDRVQSGLEFLKAPSLGGSQVTFGGSSYWRVLVKTAAAAYAVDASALKAALMAIDDPFVQGEKLVDSDSATFISEEAAQYFSLANPEIAPLLKTAQEKTALIDKALQSAASKDGPATLLASQQYQSQMEQLLGSGTTGVVGTVTEAVMSYLYVMVANSFYYSQSNRSDSDITDRYSRASAPRGWWSPFNDAPAAAYGQVRAAIFSFIQTGDDGLPVLDYAGLKAAVVAEYTSFANRRPEPESRAYYLGLIDGWATKALEPLQVFLGRDNLRRLQLGLIGESVEVAFANAVASANAALRALGDAYATRRPLSRQIALNAYGHSSVSAKAKHLENAVVRLVDTRFYFYTYVTTWDEESAPSPPSDKVDLDQNDHADVDMAAAPGDRHIDRWRLYRSNRGSEATAFQLVAEGPIGLLRHTDKKTAEELGDVCPTVTWDEPPQGLKGLVGMPNGIMAGFVGNTVWFCEPYVPYAWPVSYRVTVEHDIVGLGVFGQTLFVGTKGNPYFISGSDSASMSAQKLESQQSCSSRRSIAPVQGGVLFASPDGLCVADGSGVQVVTTGLFTREEWQKLVPENMFASQHENIYYLWHGGSEPGCLTFDLSSKKLGHLDLTATAAFNDLLTDTLYVVSGTQILAVYGGTSRRTGLWKSKRITMPQQQGMAWIKVYGDQHPADPANDVLAKPVTVRLYGDGQLAHEAIFHNLTPQRLPSGRWLEFEVEVESQARVTAVMLASSTQELQSI